MGQAAALSGLIGLTGPLAIVLKPPPVTWLGLISANIGYFIYAPFLSAGRMLASRSSKVGWARDGSCIRNLAVADGNWSRALRVSRSMVLRSKLPSTWSRAQSASA